MSVEDLVSPAIITELKDTDMSIRGSTGKETSTLVRSPGDHVHRRSVKGKIKNFSP